MEPTHIDPNPLISLIPLLIYTIIFAGIVIWLAPRKGKSRYLALIAIIPLIGSFVVFYLLVQTDKKVLDDIEYLKAAIKNKNNA